MAEPLEMKASGEDVKKADVEMNNEEEDKPSEPLVADADMDVKGDGEKTENENSTPEENKDANNEESTDVGGESAAESSKLDDEAAPATAINTESIPTDSTKEEKNETANESIKKEGDGDGVGVGDGDGAVKVKATTATSSAEEETSTPEAPKATEAKTIDPESSTNDDDTLAKEQKSELVAAAEEDAKNNKDQPAPCESAVRPNNRDVLFGRGKPFQNHPGNRKMLSYIDQYKRQYNESPRDQKRPIVEEIIGILTSGGGRFLRRYNEDVNSTWWTEVPKQVAFDKVSHAFRSRGRPKASDSAAAKASLAQARAAAAAVAHQGHHPHQQHPHHPQHAYATAHHQGQYGGVPPPGAQFTGQFGQYGMPPANFNPMITAMQQQHHHNPMMGYHPMPGGITPQQQAMMQAGMMMAMQQQQQQHVGGPPGGPPPPYYQQPPPPNPYYGQQQQHHQQPPPQQPQQQHQQQQQPQQDQSNQAQQQQHQQAPAQTPATAFPFNAYGQAPATGGFLVPPQQPQQQPGAPGFPHPGGAQSTPTEAANPGATSAPPPVQGEEMKAKQVGI